LNRNDQNSLLEKISKFPSPQGWAILLIDKLSPEFKLIELFNRVHELETELTDEQLRAILLKTDSWLMYILQISSGNFHK